jgi:hypothetical protein
MQQIYTSGEDSVWDGISGVHGKVDSTEGRIRAEIISETVSMMVRIKSYAIA